MRPNGDEKPIPPLEAGNIRIIPLGGVEEIGRNMTAWSSLATTSSSSTAASSSAKTTRRASTTFCPTPSISKTAATRSAACSSPTATSTTSAASPTSSTASATRRSTPAAHVGHDQKAPGGVPQPQALDIHEVEKDRHRRVGNLRVRFFSVTHTIPDSMGIIIETPYGSWSLPATSSSTTSTASRPRRRKGVCFFKDKKVLFLAADSTNCERPAFLSPSAPCRKTWTTSSRHRGRLIIGTFSSQLERIMRMLEQPSARAKRCSSRAAR
jgi:ribonuclease J